MSLQEPAGPRPLHDLTEREREVLALIAEGRSNQGITQTQVLSPKTVEAHSGRILAKLGLDDTRTITARFWPCWPSSAPKP